MYDELPCERAVAKKVSGWSAGPQVLREAQVSGASEQNVADYAAGVIAEAVALRAMESNDAAYDAAANRGYFGGKDIAALFDGRPVDGIVLDALAKVEAKRPSSLKK